MESTAVKHRKKFIDYFVTFLQNSEKVREALVKTYGSRMYSREMAAISRTGDFKDKVKIILFIKSFCPGLMIEDREVWDDFVHYLRTESQLALRDTALHLLPFFNPAVSIPFVLESFSDYDDAFIQNDEVTRMTLREVMWEYGDEIVPHILSRAPLKDPELASYLAPYYLRVDPGNIMTVFEHIAASFDLDHKELVEPFIDAFLYSKQVPDAAHFFLVSSFIIPMMDRYQERKNYLFRMILACKGIDYLDRYKSELLLHLESLLVSNDIEDVKVGLQFLYRYPFPEAARFFKPMLQLAPQLYNGILETFREVKDKSILDLFTARYPEAPMREKELLLGYLLAHATTQVMSLLDDCFTEGTKDEQALLLSSLWICGRPEGKKWIEYAFRTRDVKLMTAALEKLNYIGPFFTREEIHDFILIAHESEIPVNRGMLNSLLHLLDDETCRKILESEWQISPYLREDRLSFTGYFGGGENYPLLEKQLKHIDSELDKMRVLLASRDNRAVEVITSKYDKANRAERDTIADMISQFCDYRFTEIIRYEAFRYFHRVDSFTPGDAFIVPVELETGFAILESMVESGVQHSVQFMLELARYGGPKAIPVLEELNRQQSVRDTPRKKQGAALALYVAGKKDVLEFLQDQFNDDYMSTYLIYLLHDFVARENTLLLPTLETYRKLDLTPFIPELFYQLNYYYPWTSEFARIVRILSAGVGPEHIEKLTERFMGMFVDIHAPVLDALERLEMPETLSFLIDVHKVLRAVNADKRLGMQEPYFRVARLLHRLGYVKPFEHLRKKYRDQLFKFLKSPVRYFNTSIYIPDLVEVLDKDERTEIFLSYFGRYLVDPGDIRYDEEAFLKMIRGIQDERFIAPIVEQLRFCQRDVDLVPSLVRLKELTGETFGIDYFQWKKYLTLRNKKCDRKD